MNKCRAVVLLVLAISVLPSCLGASPPLAQTLTYPTSGLPPTMTHSEPSTSLAPRAMDLISPSDVEALATLAFDLTHPSTPWPTFTPSPTCAVCPSLCSTQSASDFGPIATALSPSKFIGTRFPPLPADSQSIVLLLPQSGESEPGDITYYFVFLVQHRNSFMLWLALPYKDPGPCEQYRVADSISLPLPQHGRMTVSTWCSSHGQFDPYIIAIAPDTNQGDEVTPHFAWRVNPATVALQSILTSKVQCWFSDDMQHVY